MSPLTQRSNPVSKGAMWTGHVITVLVSLFVLFDGTIKVMKSPAAMEGTTKLGYPASVVLPLGITVLVCTLLYMIPRTAILGAVLLTGYLGGATATMVRVQNAWLIFPVLTGVLAWLGPFLRDSRLRALLPLRNLN